MLCVREHVDGLDAPDAIFGCEECYVAGLGGGVTTDVYDAARLHGKELLDNLFVHSGSGRVGDDDVRASLLLDKLRGEHFGHVASKETGVVDVVGNGVLACGDDGVLDIFNAYDLAAEVRKEEGYGASAGIEVVDGVGGGKLGILRHEGVEPLCLG